MSPHSFEPQSPCKTTHRAIAMHRASGHSSRPRSARCKEKRKTKRTAPKSYDDGGTPTLNSLLGNLEHWLTPDELAARYPKITTANAVRRDIFLRNTNGLAACNACRKVGRRFLVDERAYIAWRFCEPT